MREGTVMATEVVPARQSACCCDAVHLTEREIDVLQVLAAGNTSAQTAGLLLLSRRTVDSQVASMMRKAGVRNRGELLALCVAHGLIDMSAVPPSWTGRSCLPSARELSAMGGR